MFTHHLTGVSMSGSILVTGGAGYIGSHTVLELLQSGFDVVVLDNLSNASPESLERVAAITGRRATLVVGDIRDEALLTRMLAERPFDAAIHFAGLKAVGESVQKPLAYYDSNVAGTTTLLRCMDAAGVRRIVFSSSATVYGDPESVPIGEDAKTGATNPYGRTKWFVEFVLQDLAKSDARWSIGNLRYFNPVGAHPSGRIGEDPQGIPNNLMPFVAQVAVGRREKLSVFGGDWPTKDGTGVRDYIHVVDLAEGHRAAIEHLLAAEPQLLTLNLGSGQGHSVLEVVQAFEAASGCTIPYAVVERRPGDAAITVADPSLASQLLGWCTQRGLAEICADGWAWQRQNPEGYGA
jgi:UDP-glucose 4-epimerase